MSRRAMFIISLAALTIAYLLPEGKLFWITYFAGTLLWPKILIASGVLVSMLMMVFYVAPYREASAGSAIGEVLMSLGVGLSMVVAGALAWWGTARSYRVT